MRGREVEDIAKGVTLALCRVLLVPFATGLMGAFLGSVVNVGTTGGAPFAVLIGLVCGVAVGLLIVWGWANSTESAAAKPNDGRSLTVSEAVWGGLALIVALALAAALALG